MRKRPRTVTTEKPRARTAYDDQFDKVNAKYLAAKTALLAFEAKYEAVFDKWKALQSEQKQALDNAKDIARHLVVQGKTVCLSEESDIWVQFRWDRSVNLEELEQRAPEVYSKYVQFSVRPGDIDDALKTGDISPEDAAAVMVKLPGTPAIYTSKPKEVPDFIKKK